MLELISKLQNREEGQALVEYALILALVSVASIAGLTLLGGNIQALLAAIAGVVGGVPLPG
jgi:pilus assembly protein Flp/PilA